MKKELLYIGLGKMGLNMAERLVGRGWEVVGYDPSEDVRTQAKDRGVRVEETLETALGYVVCPRVIWLMVPHVVVESVLEDILPHLSEGDTVIDGGNSPYKESVRRAELLKEKNIRFLDAGVSGGPRGAAEGACVMIGGERSTFEAHESLFQDIAAPHAYRHFGAPGAGHFVKMVHNGIEYGMMQAIAEGFALMKESDFDLDLKEVADLYNRRSVVESRLIGWLKDGLKVHGEGLEAVSGEVSHSGEGQWTVETAKELGVPVENIEQSLEFRKSSQGNPSYTGKLLSAMRNAFGGHEVNEKVKMKK